MATTQRPKGRKGKSKGRIYLAVALVGIAVLGYLWYRSRSAASTLAASPSGNQASTGAGDSGSAGGISGSPLDSSSQDLSGLISSLQGENQDLLNSYLASQSRLATPFGGVAAASQQTPAVAPAPAPAAPAAAPSLSASDFSIAGGSIPVTGVSAATPGFDQYPVLDLSNVQAAPAPSYASLPQAPVPVVAPPVKGTINPTLDLSSLGGNRFVSNPTISANKTGGSATRSQGIISVH